MIDSKRENSVKEDMKNGFLEVVRVHHGSLYRYCQELTGSSWDAEDLMQETILKAYKKSVQSPNTYMTKSYLFRIASNTWIDHLRKKSKCLERLTDELKEGSMTDSYQIDLTDYLERIVSKLPINQSAVLILIEVFQFKAGEVADMLHTTEGAVKALLYRARNKLKLEQIHHDEQEENSLEQDHQHLVQLYLRAIQYNNPNLIIQAIHNQLILCSINSNISIGFKLSLSMAA